MRTKEEECVIIPDSVIIDYYTVDGNNNLVSFSVLPLLWSEDETPGDSKREIFLCGTAVTGQNMYKQIVAWRPEISYALPVINVLSKNNLWMQLRMPSRDFEKDIVSTLVTVHCLHFLKWNLKADGSALWTQLNKAFSTFEVAPSKSHLLSHLPLIQEAAKRDKDLEKSELLLALLFETLTCQANRAKKKTKFEADSQEDCEDTDNDKIFDSVCVLCDNGGELICCEDKCLRSFHLNILTGVDSCCESLGYSDAQVEAMQTFFCNNCQYKQHQCFVCGKLGSSDQSSAPEVFQCAKADCGHFYHPNCVAELLQPCDTLKTKELQLKIYSGESFVCPAHKCNICMKGEDREVHELQFAMCRRCPKAYHRKCLPGEITFRSDGNIDQRAWNSLLPGRILIYCMDHEILSDIGTPRRDHIIFPNVEGKMQTTSGLLSSKDKLIKSRDMGNFVPRSPLEQRFNHTGIYRGRHFTKVGELEVIVDKLKWYVQDGDTIVDFCCGANDFSCLMRERLHEMGKICSFKNYDLITPKNDFNFEQKDWMTVTLEELPAGSNLIMGLNTPFGVNGCLANKFIDKALTFKPKLLILIVPMETERLDRKKNSPYDIIWEDQCILSGKAFYLPGSVDVHGKQLKQHNNLAPPLYLWSRPDWTAKHKTIAETLGHVTVTYDPIQMGKMDTGENHDGMHEDMEVDPLTYLLSNNIDQKISHEWNFKGFYPSHHTTGMQHSSGVSDSDAMGMQYPYVASDAMLGDYHEDLEGVHFSPLRQYPIEHDFYPEWPGF